MHVHASTGPICTRSRPQPARDTRCAASGVRQARAASAARARARTGDSDGGCSAAT